MCTVTYIPQAKGDFILSSNRDESPLRSPKNISTVYQDGIQLTFPRDSKAGGSWIAISDTNKVVCLLNGAFVKHDHAPPYTRSRGTMVLDYFKFPDAETFFASYDFEGMEPFTMVIVDNGSLYELRWDEKQLFPRKLDVSQKYIWSSATLYTPQIQEMREQWFEDWKKDRKDFQLEAIQHFHLNGGKEDIWNGFIMNRFDIVKTVSHTNVVKNGGFIHMIYNDLLNNAVKKEVLELQRADVL